MTEKMMMIRPGLRHFYSNHKKDKYGRRIYKSHETLSTPNGEYRIEEWVKLADEVVKESGMEELLSRIEEHCRSLPWLKEDEIHEYALECLYRESYTHWSGFDKEEDV